MRAHAMASQRPPSTSHRPFPRAATALVAWSLALAVALGAACGRSPGGANRPRLDAVPISLRDASTAPISPSETPAIPSGRPAILAVPIPGHMGNSALEVRILDKKQEIVWVGVGLRRIETGSGYVLLPAGFLGKGEYTLTVGRAQPGVSRGEFPFRVD